MGLQSHSGAYRIPGSESITPPIGRRGEKAVRHIHHQHHFHERHHKNPRLHGIVHTAMWIVAIFSPFATVPQILEIFRTHNVTGISPTTWGLYVITPCIWLSYGLLHKDKFIIINNILWATLSSTVLFGVILFQ